MSDKQSSQSDALPPRQQEIIDAIRDNPARRISITTWPHFHATTRRGWGTNRKRSWDALVRKGLVEPTGDWDHVGGWWQETRR